MDSGRQQELNVVLNGPAEACKSTIARLLVGESSFFLSAENRFTTLDGMQMYTVQPAQSDRCTINIINLPGAQDFDGQRPAYINNAQLLLYVIDLSESSLKQENELQKRFLADMKARACPRMLVGMKRRMGLRDEPLDDQPLDAKPKTTDEELESLASRYFGGRYCICSKDHIKPLTARQDDTDQLGKFILEEAKQQAALVQAQNDRSAFPNASASCSSFFKGAAYGITWGVTGAVAGGAIYKAGELSGLFALHCSLSSAVCIGAAAGVALLALILILGAALRAHAVNEATPQQPPMQV